jgi:hypothetical protein
MLNNKLKEVGLSLLGRASVPPRIFLLRCKCFVQANDGIATIEWVALAAGLVVGSLVVSFIIMQGLTGAANSIANQLK